MPPVETPLSTPRILSHVSRTYTSKSKTWKGVLAASLKFGVYHYTCKMGAIWPDRTPILIALTIAGMGRKNYGPFALSTGQRLHLN